MILILTLLPLFLTDVGAQKAQKPSIKKLLDEGMEAVFRDVNKEFVRDMEWSSDLAVRAFKKSKPQPQAMEAEWYQKKLVLRGSGPLRTFEELAAKLRGLLGKLLEVHKVVQRIPQRSQYGCNGYVITLEGGLYSVHFACIYKWN